METKILMDEKKQRRYGWFLSLLFMVVWGVAFMDRLIVSQEADIIRAALKLSEVRFTMLTAFSVGASVVGMVFFNVLSDRLGRRKGLLVPLTALCGLISCLCFFTKGYTALLILRTLYGFFMGSIMTFMNAILSVYSVPGTFGRNVGIVATGVAVFGNSLGPTVVTRLSTAYGWSTPFLLTGCVLLVVALLIQLTVREVPKVEKTEAVETEKLKTRSFFLNRNFIVCALIGMFAWVGYWSTQLYGPVYLSDVMGLAPVSRGMVSSVMGIVFIFTQLLVPILSDRFGRRPALIFTYILSMLSPLGMCLLPGSGLSVVGYCVFGGLVATTSALFGNVILMESLPEHQKTSAAGIAMASADLVGGTIWPLVASNMYDAIGGVKGIMAVVAALFLCAAVCAAFLKETNPQVMARAAAKKRNK